MLLIVYYFEFLLQMIQILQSQELFDNPTVLVLWTDQQIIDEALQEVFLTLYYLRLCLGKAAIFFKMRKLVYWVKFSEDIP